MVRKLKTHPMPVRVDVPDEVWDLLEAHHVAVNGRHTRNPYELLRWGLYVACREAYETLERLAEEEEEGSGTTPGPVGER